MRQVIAALCCLLFSACASYPCLPEGATASFLHWPVMAVQAPAVQVEDGSRVRAVGVVYSNGQDAVSVIWLGPFLVAVDFAPQDRQAPAWVDLGVVNALGEVRLKPEQRCRWERLLGQGI